MIQSEQIIKDVQRLEALVGEIKRECEEVLVVHYNHYKGDDLQRRFGKSKLADHLLKIIRKHEKDEKEWAEMVDMYPAAKKRLEIFEKTMRRGDI